MFVNLYSEELQLPENLGHILQRRFKLHLILIVLSFEGLYVDIMLRMQAYTNEVIIKDATQKFLKLLCLGYPLNEISVTSFPLKLVPFCFDTLI